MARGTETFSTGSDGRVENINSHGHPERVAVMLLQLPHITGDLCTEQGSRTYEEMLGTHSPAKA
jgi:hypothetical protein